MANQKYIVDRISDECIRVYPEKHNDANASVNKKVDVKKHKVTLYDYGEDMGFSITPQQLQAASTKEATLKVVRRFPIVTLMQSTNRFNVRISFDKASIQDAKKIIKRDASLWFDEMQKVIQLEALAAVEEGRSEVKKKKSKSIK